MSRGERITPRWVAARAGGVALVTLAGYGLFDLGRDQYEDWVMEQDLQESVINIGQSNYEKLSQANENDIKELEDVNGGSFIRVPRPGKDAIFMVLKRPTKDGEKRYAVLESADCIYEAANAREELVTSGTNIFTEMDINSLKVLVQEQLAGFTIGRITGYTIGEENKVCELERMFDFEIPWDLILWWGLITDLLVNYP